MNVSKKHMQFLERIKGCICGGNIWRYMLSDVVYEIKQTFPKYSWVGIYLLDDGALILETFLGKATSHTKIPLDKGICGASASQKKTLLIQDVNKDERYISCDIAVKSELVVPIIRNGEVLGVLDIDSNHRDAFSEEEQALMEQAVALMIDAFPTIRKQ
jgi:L-methionine (R)-S-oxide reductase